MVKFVLGLKIKYISFLAVFILVGGCVPTRSSLMEDHSPIYLYVKSLEEIYVSVPEGSSEVSSCLSSSQECLDNDYKSLSILTNISDRKIYKIDNKDKNLFIHIKALDSASSEEPILRHINLVKKDSFDSDSKSDSNTTTGNGSSSKDPKIIEYKGYQCYDTTQEVCEAEYTIFTKTNALRKSRGLSELKPNITLSYLARLWSVEQARRGNISHAWFQSGVTNQKFSKLRQESFYDSSSVSFLSAENVAANMGYTGGEAIGSALYEQWKNSPGHYQNMVGQHRYLGVGVVSGAKSMFSIYGTQLFGQ